MSEKNQISPSEITLYLEELSKGNKEALDKLYPLVYKELQRGAHRIKKQFYNLDTLNTTALVHETYLKLLQSGATDLKNRAHFFYISARAMRQILINASLRKRTVKRGDNQKLLHLDELEERLVLSDRTSEDLLLLNDALKKLELQDERQAAIVECRFFGGMTIEETAIALNISPATVKRSWSYAKAWLYVQLNEQ
ncbi:MAG: sigma-70 family RNA polymerase sigma factor [Bacteroidetes bacterium]|nr:MAG: sigma-70 family RNA polymerase sigma factor [Bacteroidota bacterium]